MNLKNEIKAFLFDVDGTLIDRKGKMSENTYNALKTLKEKGYKLGINSGRLVFSSIKALKANKAEDLFDWYYGANGIEFYDVLNNSKSYLAILEDGVMKNFDNIFKNETYLSLAFYEDDKYLVINHYPDDLNKLDKWCKLRYVLPKLEDFQNVNKRVPKMIVVFDDEKTDKLLEKLSTIKDDRVDIFFSGNDVLEIVPKGLNKGVSVIEFSKLLNIKPKEIMTFGDAENDVPALENGVGVALGDKILFDKHHISYKSLKIDDDGLYLFLKNNGFLC